MDINKKLEQIRQKPEHVRLKYVWFSVAICMLIIILVWILSTRAAFKRDGVSQNFDQLKQSFDSSNIQMPSISDLPKTEGVLDQQNYYSEDQYQPNSPQQTEYSGQEATIKENSSNSPTESTPNSPNPKEIVPTFPTE